MCTRGWRIAPVIPRLRNLGIQVRINREQRGNVHRSRPLGRVVADASSWPVSLPWHCTGATRVLRPVDVVLIRTQIAFAVAWPVGMCLRPAKSHEKLREAGRFPDVRGGGTLSPNCLAERSLYGCTCATDFQGPTISAIPPMITFTAWLIALSLFANVSLPAQRGGLSSTVMSMHRSGFACTFMPGV